MEMSPYNSCDYRCERCLETERCAVFHMESERDVRNFALGRETNGIEAALRDVEDIFSETKEMLREKAEEFGIDLVDLADAGPRDTFEETKKAPLYQRSFEITMNTQALLKEIEPVITPAGKEYFDDVVWHHTVFSAKVFRAIDPDYDPDIRFDAINSAAVAMKSLTICIMAFDKLAVLYPTLSKKCKELSHRMTGLKQSIRSRFTV